MAKKNSGQKRKSSEESEKQTPNETESSFSMAKYLSSISAEYKSMNAIDAEAKKVLDSITQEAAIAVAEDESKNPDDADDDGWQTVQRKKKPKAGQKAIVQKMGKSKKATSSEPVKPIPSRRFATAVFGNVQRKHKKNDFYSFQLTDRWRSKAERIASKLNMTKDVFGRPIQTANVTRVRDASSIRQWKNEKMQTRKNQRDVRSFQPH